MMNLISRGSWKTKKWLVLQGLFVWTDGFDNGWCWILHSGDARGLVERERGEGLILDEDLDGWMESLQFWGIGRGDAGQGSLVQISLGNTVDTVDKHLGSWTQQSRSMLASAVWKLTLSDFDFEFANNLDALINECSDRAVLGVSAGINIRHRFVSEGTARRHFRLVVICTPSSGVARKLQNSHHHHRHFNFFWTQSWSFSPLEHTTIYGYHTYETILHKKSTARNLFHH